MTWLIPIAHALIEFRFLLVIVVLGVVTWLVGVVFTLRANGMRKPSQILQRQQEQSRVHAAIATFAVLIFLGAAGFAAIKGAAIADFSPRLASASSSVSVNGQEIAHPDALIASIRGMHEPMFPGKSGPEGPALHLLMLTARGSLALELVRDSRNAREYWTYYEFDGHRTEVGRVVTDALDQF